MNGRFEVIKKILDVHDALAQNDSTLTTRHIDKILEQHDDILKVLLYPSELLKDKFAKIYKVTLTNISSRHSELIQVIKTIREITGMGLREAKDCAENLPQVIVSKVTLDEANAVKAKLVAQGATVTVATMPEEEEKSWLPEIQEDMDSPREERIIHEDIVDPSPQDARRRERIDETDDEDSDDDDPPQEAQREDERGPTIPIPIARDPRA
jgi:ribosomal protein L7/L12